MTTPSNEVLDAIAQSALARDVIEAAYAGQSAIQIKLSATTSRGVQLCEAIADYHGISIEDLADLVEARPTWTGGTGALCS